MRTSRPGAAASLFLLFALCSFAFPQTAPRLPFITGNEVVNVLVETDGSVKTWGDPWRLDMSPSLGDGKKPSRQSGADQPRALPGVSGIVTAAVGPTHVLLLRNDGTVLAWGENDGCEVGSKEEKSTYAPVAVPGLHGIKDIAAGYQQSAAIDADGGVWLWGTFPGQSGCQRTPTRVQGISGARKISMDTNAILVLKTDGTVVGWGPNENGELCDGTTTKRTSPAPIRALSKVVDLVSGTGTYFLLSDGTVKTCGAAMDGTLAMAKHLTPFQVPGLSGARSINYGNGAVFARLADNTLLGWGNGYHGSLGDGFGDRQRNKPHPPKGLGPVAAHYMSGGVSYALKSDGTVLTWGLAAPEGYKTEFYLTPTPVFKVKLQ